MKTLLVLAQHPDLANSIRECLNSEQYKVVHRLSIEDAEPLLIHGLINAAIIDVDLTDVQGIWIIEKLRRNLPKCPILLFAGPNWEWEEEAYLHGVAHILTNLFVRGCSTLSWIAFGPRLREWTLAPHLLSVLRLGLRKRRHLSKLDKQLFKHWKCCGIFPRFSRTRFAPKRCSNSSFYFCEN